MTRDELRDTVRTVINELWDEVRKPQGERRPLYALSKAGDTIMALFDEATAWVPVTPETMPPNGLLVWLTDGEHVGPGRHNVTDSHNIHEWSGHRVGRDWRDYGYRRTPTHWMLIQVPESPKAKETRE